MALLMRTAASGTAVASTQRQFASIPSTAAHGRRALVQQQLTPCRPQMVPGFAELATSFFRVAAYTPAGYAEPRQYEEAAPNPKLFISNLPWQASEEDVYELFNQFPGLLNVRIIMQNDRSKGMAVIEYESTDAAAVALQEMGGTDVGGRQINVRFDRPPPPRDSYPPREYDRQPRYERSERAPRRDRDNSDRPPRPTPELGTQVIVKNVPFQADWMHIKSHFEQVGEVLFVSVPKGEDLRPRGFAIVQYASKDGASRAVQDLHDSEIDGRALNVQEFIPRPRD